MRKCYRGLVVGLFAIAALCFCIESAGALTFNFIAPKGMSQQALNAFKQAGDEWSAALKDPITVNININFTSLGSGILAQTSYNEYSTSYSSFRSALTKDGTSAADSTAVSHLASGSSFGMLINRTANDPYGRGSATPYLDNNGNANNKTIDMTTANAKALGLLSSSSRKGRVVADGSIAFSSAYQWDFNPADGINTGAFDFVGIAAHEIGHALGFVSGVDVLDTNSTRRFYNDSAFVYVSPLDMFRYSTQSAAAGVIDWTADARDKYFSIDGGATDLASFSTGEVWGDGYQASHWKDGLGIGIMDPTAAPGELLSMSDLDLEALDVIGWNLGATSDLTGTTSTDGLFGPQGRGLHEETNVVPEPITIVLLATGLLGIAGAARRKLRK